MTGKEKVNNMTNELLAYLMVRIERCEETREEVYVFYYPTNDDILDCQEFDTENEAIDYAIAWLTNEVKE